MPSQIEIRVLCSCTLLFEEDVHILEKMERKATKLIAKILNGRNAVSDEIQDEKVQQFILNFVLLR